MSRAEFDIRRKGPRNAAAGSPRTLQSRGWRQGAQNKNASHDLSKVVIGRYEAFGVQLAERDMQCPLVRPDLSKTVQREIDALTETDSRGASEQERIGRQVIGPAQFVAEKWIVLWRERSGQILGPLRRHRC